MILGICESPNVLEIMNIVVTIIKVIITVVPIILTNNTTIFTYI